MRRLARHAYAVSARYRRIDREPVDGRALLPRLIDHVAVNGERQRHLARYHHVGENRVAAAHRQAVARRHLGSSRSAQRFGRSCFLTARVLYACTKTLMNCGAQPRWAGRVPSAISLCQAELISCRRFSRTSASSSGEETLTASKSQRFALFSAAARCNTLAEDARHASTRTP